MKNWAVWKNTQINNTEITELYGGSVIFQYSPIMYRIIAVNLPLAPRLRGRFFKGRKNNLSFASPSIRCPTIRGWINYFKIGSMKTLCKELDANIRFRLRKCIWKHWKNPQTRERNLMKLGIDKKTAHKAANCSRAYAQVCSCGAVNIAITNKRLTSFG